MRVLDVVNVLVGLVAVEGSHAGTLGAQMRMIICSVEQIGDTGLSGYYSKESTHTVVLLKDDLIY
jgi:hypothetical protein